jgi:ribosomal protein L37AE/L43A
MKGSSTGSRQDLLVCPSCEGYELKSRGPGSARCAYCGVLLGEAMLHTLKEILTLTNATGSHPCECGHPEMRRLPDGIYHCPACGSEVLPVGATDADRMSEDHSRAYWSGWIDGRFGGRGSFVDNPNLARWESPSCRLDYYRGHRSGREARRVRERRVA